MTLSEVRAIVLRKIKRPERTAEAVDAINAAIEFICTKGDYAWDLVEGTLPIDATAFAQSVVISSSFTRFRKMKYIRPTGYRKPLLYIAVDKIFEQGREIVDSWYRAGDRIVFKLRVKQPTIEYGYYSYPAPIANTTAGLVSTNNYLTHMPYLVADLATAYEFGDIGNDAESNRYERRAMMKLAQMQADRQDGVSYS